MLLAIKRKANIATALGLLGIIGARLLGNAPGQPAAAGVPVVPLLLIAVATVLFTFGTWMYARSKGHHGAWGLLVPIGFALVAVCWFYVGAHQRLLKWAGGILAVIGLFILAFLPDEHPWGK
jgi:hypothetical protein